MATTHVQLIAPDGVKYETEATSVTLPSSGGQITVLPHHMPLIALLKPGEITLHIDGKQHHLATEGGLVEIANNTVKILAETAEDVANLDELKIEEARKVARERMIHAQDETEYAEGFAMMEKQLAKLNVLKRRKKYR